MSNYTVPRYMVNKIGHEYEVWDTVEHVQVTTSHDRTTAETEAKRLNEGSS